MKNLFKNRYRVVSDKYAGYEAQIKYWWFPFWLQMSGVYSCCNTYPSLEKAQERIEQSKKRRIVYWESNK